MTSRGFIVEYYKRTHKQGIVSPRTLSVYAMSENRCFNMVEDVLMSLDRVEYYVKAPEGNIIGSFFMTIADDMHHGRLAILAAHWIDSMYRNNYEVHRLVMWHIKRFCETHGVTKYQRTVNVSSSRQLLITKEVY